MGAISRYDNADRGMETAVDAGFVRLIKFRLKSSFIPENIFFRYLFSGIFFRFGGKRHVTLGKDTDIGYAG